MVIQGFPDGCQQRGQRKNGQAYKEGVKNTLQKKTCGEMTFEESSHSHIQDLWSHLKAVSLNIILSGVTSTQNQANKYEMGVPVYECGKQVMSQLTMPIYLVTIETVLLNKLAETIGWHQQYTLACFGYIKSSSGFRTIFWALFSQIKCMLR